MPEKILFRVRGLHALADDEEKKQDEIEVINVADYYYKDGAHYIHYEEIMDGTEGLTKNMVKVKPDKVEIIKKGAVRSHMVFESGKTNESLYYMPEGQLQMAVDTKSVEIREEENGLVVQIQYAMLMNYQKVADCDLTMAVERKENK